MIFDIRCRKEISTYHLILILHHNSTRKIVFNTRNISIDTKPKPSTTSPSMCFLPVQRYIQLTHPSPIYHLPPFTPLRLTPNRHRRARRPARRTVLRTRTQSALRKAFPDIALVDAARERRVRVDDGVAGLHEVGAAGLAVEVSPDQQRFERRQGKVEEKEGVQEDGWGLLTAPYHQAPTSSLNTFHRSACRSLPASGARRRSCRTCRSGST
jgi:hypothetical protein